MSHPTWEVIAGNDSYKIKQKIKSFERSYYVEGGLFDGVIVEGGHFDQQFRIRHGDQILAQASEEVFSMKEKHVIDVLDGSEQINLFSAVVSIIISEEKQQARANRNQKITR